MPFGVTGKTQNKPCSPLGAALAGGVNKRW
jgi:hypothetical protein